MSDFIDIQPGTVAQVVASLTGPTILVEQDVQNVASDLKAINPDFNLHYDKAQDLWVVMQLHDGEEKLVTTATECDQRIVARVREITKPGYDLAAEIAKNEAEAEAAQIYDFNEAFGERAERLSHALRTDLSRHEIDRTRKSNAFIPGPKDAA